MIIHTSLNIKQANSNQPGQHTPLWPSSDIIVKNWNTIEIIVTLMRCPGFKSQWLTPKSGHNDLVQGKTHPIKDLPFLSYRCPFWSAQIIPPIRSCMIHDYSTHTFCPTLATASIFVPGEQVHCNSSSTTTPNIPLLFNLITATTL